MSKKIAFIVSGYPPDNGIFYHRSFKVISKIYGVKVFRIRSLYPIIKNPIFNYEYDSIKVKQIFLPFLPIKSLKYLKFLGFFSSFFIEEIKNFDLIHCGSFYPLGIISSIWAKKFNIPLIGQAVGINEVEEILKALQEEKLKKFFERFDYIITNSEDLKKRILFYVNYKNIEVVYRGVDCKIFNENGEKDESFSKLDGFKFLYLGGFQTKDPKKFDRLNVKGAHILLKAWGKAEAELNDCYLGIGGPGCDLEYLEEWRKNLKKQDKVIIISRGRISPDKIPILIRSFDCVIIPSLSEGLPNLANEAQACGKPVIGTDVGGIPETVINNKTGLIIKSNNHEELADALLWFSRNKERAKEMGKEGAKWVRSAFTWDIYLEKIEKIYNYVWDLKKK